MYLDLLFPLGSLVFLILTIPFVRWLMKRDPRQRSHVGFPRSDIADQFAEESAKAPNRDLLVGLIHDTRNLLNAAVGNMELLRATEQLTERGERFVGLALKAIDDAKASLIPLRAIGTHPHVQKFGIVDVNEVIREAVEVTEAQRKIREKLTDASVDLRIELAPVPTILGDPNALRMLFVNLISNALEAMPQGGQLKLLTEKLNDDVRVKVSDTGEGIPPESIERIFEPFFTTKAQGSGLGLSIARNTVLRHHGEIRLLDSQKRKGTTFEIKFPSASKVLAQMEPQGKKILVVEDDQNNLEILKSILSSTENQFTFCQTGRDALEKIQHEKFDIVLADLVMPGVSGDVIARSVKEINPSTPVILITGYATEELERTYKDHGFDVLVSKPFRREELLKAMADVSQN